MVVRDAGAIANGGEKDLHGGLPHRPGTGNFAVAIGRLLGMGAALALGTSNGQSIGDAAGPGVGSVAGDLIFRNFLNRVGVPPGARARRRRRRMGRREMQESDTLNYMGVDGLSYSAGAGIGLGTGCTS